MERLIKGVQLPPDSSGRITGGFIIADPSGDTDSSGLVKQVVIPATVIVDSTGAEIGQEILDTLNRIADVLEKSNDFSELTVAALTD